MTDPVLRSQRRERVALNGVLCAGTVLVDVSKVIDAYPQLDRMATIELVSQSTGGPGLNLAVDLAQLGASFPIGMLGVVGDDPHGTFILAELERLKIDITGVRMVGGAATSFTDGDGPTRRRPAHVLPPSRCERAVRRGHGGPGGVRREDPARPRAPGIHRVMDAPGPDGGNGWSALLKRAQAIGMHTNLELVDLNARPDGRGGRAWPSYLDSVVINELEAGALTGIYAPVPGADGPVDWPAFEAMAMRLIEACVSRSLPLATSRPVVWPPHRAAGRGGRDPFGCRAIRYAARPVRATRSPPA